jgi:alpha-galactosidase
MRFVKPLVTLAILLVSCTPSSASAQALRPTAAEMATAQQFASRLADDGAAKATGPCFSFTCDGNPSTQLLNSWKCKASTRRLDEERTENTVTWTDPKTGLEVRRIAVEYSDFPVVEWTVYLKNAGKADTPILSDIQGLDVAFPGQEEQEFVLHTIRGDETSPASYQPVEKKIGRGVHERFAPVGGVPTNKTFPCFNVEWSGQGVIAVLGWPGQWAMDFAVDKSSGLTIRGGQELTKMKLRPGEEIRTPLAVLMFWEGDVVRSQNLWRRWMIAHNIPRINHGKLPPTFTYGMGHSALITLPAAKAEMADMDAYHQAGVKHDFWLIDAGWYPCDGVWQNTGTWEPDPTRFPKGVKELSDHAHKLGMKFILWFEPERVAAGSWLAKNHPEWIIGGEKGGLLNMGNPDARKWVIERFDRLISEQGVDLYREDFNMNPMEFWRSNDTPDRQGITENLYVQGQLAYWDELRRRHPNMLLDSCSGGGRRNDLERLRRAIPLHRSDYYSAAAGRTLESMTGTQGHTYGLAMWVPYFGTGVYCENVYEARSHLTPALGIVTGNAGDTSHISPELRPRMNEWKAVADEFYGDYYPLTPYSLAENAWMAWQFNRPEVGSGMIQAFRHEKSPEKTLRVKLQGLDAGALYTVTNLDVPDASEMTGRELSEKGLAVTIDKQPGAAIITYKKKS